MLGWLRLAVRQDIVLRGVKVALVVGSILVLINYGDLLLKGQWLPAMAWKIPMTYLVPYCVATYASVEAALKVRDL